MRTIITILLSILFIGNVNAQQVDSLNITETERIIDKYSGKIADTFEKGLEKMTPVAEEGFEIMVRFQIVKGIVGLIPLFIVIICIVLLGIYLPKAKWGSQVIFPDTMVIISIFLGFLFFIGAMIETGDAIRHLMLPEYYAIQDIINLFK